MKKLISILLACMRHRSGCYKEQRHRQETCSQPFLHLLFLLHLVVGRGLHHDLNGIWPNCKGYRGQVNTNLAADSGIYKSARSRPAGQWAGIG